MDVGIMKLRANVIFSNRSIKCSQSQLIKGASIFNIEACKNIFTTSLIIIYIFASMLYSQRSCTHAE